MFKLGLGHRWISSNRILPAVLISQTIYFSKFVKITPKKLKSSNAEQKSSSPQLSDEQLDRMAQNKKAALDKLRAKETPAGFGETWRRELAAEFEKPYFKQVTWTTIAVLLPHLFSIGSANH